MWKTEQFISRKDDVVRYFENRDITASSVAEYCSMAGIPIIVVYRFLGDEFPDKKEFCEGRIGEIREFYGI